MKVPLLDLKAQYAPLREEIRTAMDEVCDAQQFILGARVQAFEAHVAAYCGVPYAIGLSSGTDALLAALMSLDIGPGDAVITSPFTFFATIGSIVRLGAFPLMADIDPVTFNLSPAGVRSLIESPPRRLKKRTIKALMPVHLFGQCADMNPLLDLARQYGLCVIEDAAQAIGAEYPARTGVSKAGAMGDIGCFSFFPSKNLGGFGDGGMAVTRNATLDSALRTIRVHGSAEQYRHDRLSGNFRLDALQAAVLDVKLKHLESWHAARRVHAAFYDHAFQGSKVQAPRSVYAGQILTNHHIYNQYVIRVAERDRVQAALQKAGIGCAIYYPVPMHLQPCFRYLGYHTGDFPESEQAAREVLALPIYPELTEAMQQAVADEVLKAAG
ncbi:MAG: DegT/DnrJ/EryC1/StrS family aminotransferase [Kiritimatiellae bacterium]|nr:DegT/DnrJ/EryC1/StrS family aminotransferase [Kiritimatiellia bacterium]